MSSALSANTIQIVVEPFDPSRHTGIGFDCGDQNLNTLANNDFSRLNIDSNTLMVLVTAGEDTTKKPILGYIWGMIDDTSDLPCTVLRTMADALNERDLSAIIIHRMAVDISLQTYNREDGSLEKGVGAGKFLLATFATLLLKNHSADIIALYSRDESRAFYAAIGFEGTSKNPNDRYMRVKPVTVSLFSDIAKTPLVVRSTELDALRKRHHQPTGWCAG